MKNSILTILFVFCFQNVFSQEPKIHEFTTTYQHHIDMPTKDGFQNKPKLGLWQIFIEQEFILLTIDEEQYQFVYNDFKIVTNKDDKIVINYYGDNIVITLIMENNYVKIRYASNPETTSSGDKSYKEITVFSNYKIDTLLELLSN